MMACLNSALGQHESLVWVPSRRVYIEHSVNVTEAGSLVTDLLDDAVKFSKRHNGSIEVLFAKHMASKYDRALRQVVSASQGQAEQSGVRRKRNIFGSILHSLTDVVTEDEMAVEHHQIVQLKAEVGSVLKKELSMYKAVSEMRAREDTFEAVQRDMADILHKTVNDAGYFSRKQWRLEMLHGVIDEMYAFTDAAFSGKASVRRAAESISLAGGEGIGQVSHSSLRIEKDTIRHVVYYDIGETRIVSMEYRNDTTVATVGSNIYLLSPDYREGTPIGIADVRLAGSGLRAGSAYRIGGYTYRIVTDISLECDSGTGHGGVQVLKAGKVFRAGGEVSCYGGGLTFGPRGFKKEIRRLGSMPSVHPTLLRSAIDNEEKFPVFRDSVRSHDDRLSDDLRKDVEETQVMLEELGSDDFDQHSHSVTYGFAGLAALLLIGCMAFALCRVWKKYCKDTSNQYTYTVRYQNHPPPTRPPRASSLGVQYGKNYLWGGVHIPARCRYRRHMLLLTRLYALPLINY
jgi:hypothetical protein